MLSTTGSKSFIAMTLDSGSLTDPRLRIDDDKGFVIEFPSEQCYNNKTDFQQNMKVRLLNIIIIYSFYIQLIYS